MSNSPKNIADIRKDYSRQELAASSVAQNPLDQFKLWLNEALNASLPEPTAMVVATVDASGKPSSRVVLLKGIEDDGLVFYTNYLSRKGDQIAVNPYVCINFFWAELERQVRVEGLITKVSATMSDAYFSSRPRASQLGAWVSPQSKIIESRAVLEKRVEELTARFEGKEVPRPEHWGGYKLSPESVEFWQGRPSRLHDRILYTLEGGSWKISRLAP
jgi:pyridoxamine 5'-phosphate oxidase